MEDRQDEPIDDLLDRATEALRRTPVAPGPPPDVVARAVDAALKAYIVPINTNNRTKNMKRIIKIAVAASIFVAVGFFVSWITMGSGSSNIAFAAVAEALDNLRSATYDIALDGKGYDGPPPVTGSGKGFFRAPSLQRTECSTDSGKGKSTMITIFDSQAGKAIVFMPSRKIAMSMDMKRWNEDMRKKGTPPDLFETVRRLVREGSSGAGEKVERLGKKEIDGHPAVGFRTRTNVADMTLWADPETARPIRIEMAGEMFADVRMVMSNFRYDVALDPSLFSLEPPAGYSTQSMNMAMPVEEDLLRTLRTVAEHNKGAFPAKLGMTKEVMESLMELVKPGMDKLEAKYGVKPKPGEHPPAAMLAEAMKTLMPLVQKEMQGIMFCTTLKPENDPHYQGGGVKLGTPDRPIFWYKPTGAAKYRVIFADLSVKEMTADEVKKLPAAGTK